MGDYFEFRNKSAHMRFALRRKSRWEREDVVRYNFIFENVDDLCSTFEYECGRISYS